MNKKKELLLRIYEKARNFNYISNRFASYAFLGSCQLIDFYTNKEGKYFGTFEVTHPQGPKKTIFWPMEKEQQGFEFQILISCKELVSAVIGELMKPVKSEENELPRKV